jgi:hypothetical protein
MLLARYACFIFTIWGSLLWGLAGAQTVIYDFATNAPGATWTSGVGGVTWGTAAATGTARYQSGTLEDGTSQTNYLYTCPDYQSGVSPHFIKGVFSNLSIPTTYPLVQFKALVGLVNGATSSDGMTYSLQMLRNGEWYELGAVTVVYDGLFNLLMADLSSFKGQTITLALVATPGPAGVTTCDWGVWKSAVLQGTGTNDYDFIANAASAAWSNPMAGVTFGVAGGAEGTVQLYTGLMEDGVSYTNYLYTRPDMRSDTSVHYMQGNYTVAIPDSPGVQLQARIGYRTGASASDGVSFDCWVIDQSGIWRLLNSTSAYYDSQLDLFTADLSAYRGQTRQVILRSSQIGNNSYDWSGWTEARLVTCTPPVFYDCVALAGNTANVTWINGAGATTFGPTADTGYAKYTSGYLEDGLYYVNFLNTHPGWRGGLPKWFTQGTFANVILPNNVTDIKFIAKVGLISGAQTSDGVNFKVYVDRYGQLTELASKLVTYDSALDTLTANLTGYQGENIKLVLYVDANIGGSYDWGAWPAAYVQAQLPRQVFVTDAGGIANDGANDLTAINKALRLAAAAQPAEVLFGCGTWNVSGMVQLSGKQNLNLRGLPDNSSVLVNSNPNAHTIQFYQSSNLSARYLTIDYDPLPWTQGSVSSIDTTNKRFTFTVDTGYPNPDNAMFNLVDDFGVYQEPSAPGRLLNNTADFVRITTLTQQSAGVYRLTMTDVRNLTTSAKFVFGHRAAHACDATFCTGGPVVWDQMTIWASPGLCFAGIGNERMFVRNSKVQFKPSTTRLAAATADGVHIQSNRVGPEVINNTFTGMLDDGVNIYAMGTQILAKQSDTRVSLRTEGRPLNLGDALLLFRPGTGEAFGPVTVATIYGDVLVGSTWCKDVGLSAAPTTIAINSDSFFNLNYEGDGYLIYGNTFQNYRGRGILAKPRNGWIMKNTFSYLCNWVICLENDAYFNEGFLPQNILVKNNTFNYNVFNINIISHYASGVIRAGGFRSDGYETASRLATDLTITSNTITGYPKNAIFISSADRVTISNNYITNPASGTKATSGWRGAMYFNNARNVTVTSNTVVDSRSAAQVNGKLFLKSAVASDVTTSGNSYTMNTSQAEEQVVTTY